MSENPSRGGILILTEDAERFESLARACAALGLSAAQRQSLSDAAGSLRVIQPAFVVLDSRVLSDTDELVSAARRLTADGSGVGAAPRFAILAQEDDIRCRLAAMRAGADAVFMPQDDADSIAVRLAALLGVQRDGPTKVLVVDDQPVAALFASRVLQGAGIVTERVMDPMEVLSALERFEPDLVLMDLHMPGASGIELTGVIRGQDRFADLPIIFLSAELDPNLQMAALRIGGDDFLSKPVAPDRLVEVVRARLERAKERRRRSRGLEAVDPLTRLATRERLLKRLDWLLGQAYSAQSVARSGAGESSRAGHRAIVYLDVMGVEESLELVAAEVAGRIRPGDLAARVSDRAIAVLVCRPSHRAIAEFAQSLLFGVGQLLEERTIGADVGGGWYPLTGACKDAVTLLSRAGKAARWSLRGGKAAMGHYDHARSVVEPEDHRMEILEAVRFERVELLYEPMVALAGIVGERYELTPRVVIGDGEVLPPAEFMSVIARAGLASRFDRWLLGAGLDVLKRKMQAKEPVLLFIHQSLYGLVKEDWTYWLRDQINARDLIRLRPVLQLEIAEADRQLDLAISRARQLSRLGIRLCLNGLDFSERSMRVLHAVPSSYVRIGRRVIHGPDADSIAWLIQSIKACGARVIATGVDGPAAIARLLNEGVDLIQGPYIQPPSVAMDFEFGVSEGDDV